MRDTDSTKKKASKQRSSTHEDLHGSEDNMLTGRSNLLLVCALAGALSGLLASYIETILWDVTVLSFGPTIASFYAGGIFGCLIAMAISLAYRPKLNSLSVMLFVGLIGGGVGKVAGGVVLDIILATLATS